MEDKKTIILDLEGTIVPIDFVKKTLFPYAYDHLPQFLEQNVDENNVKNILDSLTQEHFQQSFTKEKMKDVTKLLLTWIEEDKKETHLKSLQGLIWEKGYRAGEIEVPFYPEVKSTFDYWKSKNIDIGIYSSGSVLAQKLLFEFSQWGDIRQYIAFYFDTNIGGKKESKSYSNILSHIKRSPNHCLFLSDVPQELEAAKEVEINVIQVVRDGTLPSDELATIKTLTEVRHYFDEMT